VGEVRPGKGKGRKRKANKKEREKEEGREGRDEAPLKLRAKY
jgi:hypothetical protein